MKALTERERIERVLDALAGNVCLTDEDLEANIRRETYQYDRRLVRQRRYREEAERHGEKSV